MSPAAPEASPPEHLLVRACLGLPVERTPVWAMRQAGRWDPEFVRLRGNRPFYEFAADPEASAAASLLPRRFGVDAIILFYDITTLPMALGWPFGFRPGAGPVSELVPSTREDLAPLRQSVSEDAIAVVVEVLKRVRGALKGELPVIAFAGAPFTVATYCIGTGKDVEKTRAFAAEFPRVWGELLDLLAERTIEFLQLMRRRGADVLQLFDSWAGQLTRDEYDRWAQTYHQHIFAGLPAPRILYVRECPYVDAMVESGADVVSLGTSHDLAACRSRYPETSFQGNVDAKLMATGTPEQVREAALRCLEQGGGRRHILNLSEGMPKDARPENFAAFVAAAREWQPRK